MIDALYAAASGMTAQQTGIDVIANNLSNSGTVGFKRDRIDMVDLAYQPFKLPNAKEGNLGLGAGPGAVGKEMSQGVFEETGRPYDIGIQDEGFFQVLRPDGTLAYSRAGNFNPDTQGRLQLAGGERLEPPITIPPNAIDPVIDQDGTVKANVNGSIQPLGVIRLATFPNPSGLLALGGNLYKSTANSGTPRVGFPGTEGRGTVFQGYAEDSNVNVAMEMVTMVTAQRSFEAASKVVSASDEMWGIANGMRR